MADQHAAEDRMTTDPLDLARRLREMERPVLRDDREALNGAADLIESQHAEIERLRAVEKAALELAEDVLWLKAEEWVRTSSGMENPHAGYVVVKNVAWEALRLSARAALRAALREKGVESE